MEEYFIGQPKEKDGIPQKQYFIVETLFDQVPEGGTKIKLEVKSVLPGEVNNLSDTYSFVRLASGTVMPVLKLNKEKHDNIRFI
jgi:hypothetical protein